ncbi:hypothetical protein AAGG74_16085 [Bacillus mexicanus]|uniref:hypothetical protein n=1 Tax=Bacillus mexicanus TaxID=2834415 RepID=UPI003D212A3E
MTTTFMTHVKYGGVYEFDKSTNELSSVLKTYHTDGTITHNRSVYSYQPGEYVEISESEINKIDSKYKEILKYEGKTITESEDYE